jgi:cell division septation protein DedD
MTSGEAQLRREVQLLAARVSELSVLIEGPLSHLRQSNEETLAALEARLAKLEQGAVPAGKAPAAPSLVKKAPAKRAAEPPPAATAEPGWVINLVSLRSKSDAEAEMQRLRRAGVRVELQRAVRDGTTWYRLRVPGFTSYEGAKAYIGSVEKQAGVRNAWVSKE